MTNIKVPYLAEGVESGTVVSILVKVGDSVKKDQTIAELETKKAVAPIPSTAAGKVTKILVNVGDEVAIGQALIEVSEDSGFSGTKEERAESIRMVQKPAVKRVEPNEARDWVSEEEFVSHMEPAASPSVRKLARELGIDLRKVKGSERGGRIILEDVRMYVKRLEQRTRAGIKSGTVPERRGQSLPDFSKWGPVTKKPLSQLRRAVAEKMSEAWTTIPHVTQHDEADITDLMEIRKKYAPLYEERKAKLTVTSFLLKVIVQALRKYPKVNSSLDLSAKELVYKEYYNIGVAVDTEQGLMVPVLKNADKKSTLELSIELAELAEKARQRKVSLDDLSGGTFTISNLGSIGGGHFTPIVNAPEVAILGVGRSVLKPVIRNKKMDSRLMLPLSLSYDHRVIDGADGARFIREIVALLENFNESDLKLNVGARGRAPVQKMGKK